MGGSNGSRQAAPRGTRAPNERGRQLRRPLLFAFNFRRLRDVFVGQFTKLCSRFGVGHSASMVPAFFGLISQKGRALRHGATLSQGRIRV